MIVKDLFDNINFEDFWEYFYNTYLKLDNDTKEIIETLKISHNLAFLKIKKIKPIINNNNILIGHKILNIVDNKKQESNKVSLYHIDEIKSTFKENKKIEEDFDFSKLNIEELDKYINNHKEINNYAYDYNLWNETTGFLIEENSLKDIGKKEFLAYIFNEMTYLGCNESIIKKERKKLDKSIEELMKDVLQNKNLNPFKDEININNLEEFPSMSNTNKKNQILLNLENEKKVYKYLLKIKKESSF